MFALATLARAFAFTKYPFGEWEKEGVATNSDVWSRALGCLLSVSLHIQKRGNSLAVLLVQ